MGAYFSLLAYNHFPLRQCLFLSPVLDMDRIIKNMMTWFSVSDERLKVEKEISTPIGQTLDWVIIAMLKHIQLIHGISQLPFFMALKMTCLNMMLYPRLQADFIAS